MGDTDKKVQLFKDEETKEPFTTSVSPAFILKCECGYSGVTDTKQCPNCLTVAK